MHREEEEFKETLDALFNRVRTLFRLIRSKDHYRDYKEQSAVVQELGLVLDTIFQTKARFTQSFKTLFLLAKRLQHSSYPTDRYLRRFYNKLNIILNTRVKLYGHEPCEFNNFYAVLRSQQFNLGAVNLFGNTLYQQGVASITGTVVRLGLVPHTRRLISRIAWSKLNEVAVASEQSQQVDSVTLFYTTTHHDKQSLQQLLYSINGIELDKRLAVEPQSDSSQEIVVYQILPKENKKRIRPILKKRLVRKEECSVAVTIREMPAVFKRLANTQQKLLPRILTDLKIRQGREERALSYLEFVNKNVASAVNTDYREEQPKEGCLKDRQLPWCLRKHRRQRLTSLTVKSVQIKPVLLTPQPTLRNY